VGSDGQRSAARSVPVGRKDFSKKGFELFLQVPDDSPGMWLLEPSLVLEDRTLWGHPAEFHMAKQWPGFPDGPESGSSWADALGALQETGFRDMRWGGFRGLWNGEVFGGSGMELQWAADGQSLTLRAETSNAPDGGKECLAIVWIVVPGARLLEGEFLGTRSAAWRRLVDRGVTVIASHAPLSTPGSNPDMASRRMAKETQHLGDVPRILVVRGNQARGLGLGPKRVFEGFDALVLQSPRSTEAALRAPFAGAPTLFLLPSDPWESPAVASGQKATASMDPPAVMAKDLPRYLLENLELLTSQGGPEKATGAEPR